MIPILRKSTQITHIATPLTNYHQTISGLRVVEASSGLTATFRLAQESLDAVVKVFGSSQFPARVIFQPLEITSRDELMGWGEITGSPAEIIDQLGATGIGIPSSHMPPLDVGYREGLQAALAFMGGLDDPDRSVFEWIAENALKESPEAAMRAFSRAMETVASLHRIRGGDGMRLAPLAALTEKLSRHAL